MEHQPHNPEDRDRDIPEQERLWPGEIDLTGAVEQDDALADVIGDAIVEAQASGGEVPEWGARTLARALANQLDDPHSGALHHFAVTGRADKEAIGLELAGIYGGTADDEIKEWVNWLGPCIVNLPEQPVDPLPDETTNNPQVEQGIREHGDAFRAYLELPDIDRSRDDLLTTFHAFYIGTYDAMPTLLEAMTDIRACKAEVDAVAQRWGFEEFFIIDEERLEAVARATWDIVEISGKLYVFSK